MAKLLPLFPLSLVVYPGERLKLHIFEPRYRVLISECIDYGTTFGIPAVVEKSVVDIATEVRLLKIDKKYSGGELDITTLGMNRIRVLEFMREASGKPYPGGEVEPIDDDPASDSMLQKKIFTLLKQLHGALGITKDYSAGPAGVSAFDIAHHVGFNLKQEYELLEIDRESKRLDYIKDHLERILPVIMETERLKAKAKLNGHYKNILPPDF